MPAVIVSDTSCLILFRNIGELDLLHRVYGTIIITETVAREFNGSLPPWILMQNPQAHLTELESVLDAGEVSSIALALEYRDALLIIDEARGRKIAKEMGVSITGSLGTIILAKEKGFVPTVRPIMEKIMQTNFRMSDKLLNKILHLANEK